MLPFLKRKSEGIISAQPAQIEATENGEVDDFADNEDFLSGLGDDEFNINNEDFLSLIQNIVRRHITRMK